MIFGRHFFNGNDAKSVAEVALASHHQMACCRLGEPKLMGRGAHKNCLFSLKAGQSYYFFVICNISLLNA